MLGEFATRLIVLVQLLVIDLANLIQFLAIVPILGRILATGRCQLRVQIAV